MKISDDGRCRDVGKFIGGVVRSRVSLIPYLNKEIPD